VGEISGVGLGLVNLQKVLHLHKGKIEVESEIDNGYNLGQLYLLSDFKLI
jgi:nitrogen-specific signal transduction histidine kinase